MTELHILLERLAQASQSRSLRELARTCDVSHETVRYLLAEDKNEKMITMKTFRKIDQGLTANGF